MPKTNRRRTATQEDLDARRTEFIEFEDPMVAHQAVVDAVAAGLPVPEWVVEQWARWARRLIKVVGRGRTPSGQQIGIALDLLDRGKGRGSPISRAAKLRGDALNAGAVDKHQEDAGVSREKIFEIHGEFLGPSAKAIKSRYERHRARNKSKP